LWAGLESERPKPTWLETKLEGHDSV